MLSPTEQIAFILLVVVCGGLAFQGFRRIYVIVSQGKPSYRTDDFPLRLIKALIDVGLQKPLFKARPIVSLFHAFIFFGFCVGSGVPRSLCLYATSQRTT